MEFPTGLKSIQQRLEAIQPIAYAQSRNYVNGAVTCLSPYISRGVISLPQAAAVALRKHAPSQIQKFLQELAWREYWQRVWEQLGDDIFADIKRPQENTGHQQMIAAIQDANTGIEAIDEHIRFLYQTGYLHNHVRMYVSSMACNIARAHWKTPSQWMYYHLLDGDIASNTLSWQWVAGTFSSKKYYCNQENINRYTFSKQQNSYLDCSYEQLTVAPVPSELKMAVPFAPTTSLPVTTAPVINDDLPVLIYNSYNLDPHWHKDDHVNRILLLEPSHFKKYPVSDKVMAFTRALAGNISNIQIFTGEWGELKAIAPGAAFIFKQHPAFTHYSGKAERYDYLFPEVTGYYPSFSAYWKRCEKYLATI